MDFELGWALPQVVGFLLVVARLSGMFLIAPVFSSPMIPPRFKMMALLGLAVTITPVLDIGMANVPTGAVALLVAVITEVLVGLAMGFAVSIVFAAVQVGASLIDTAVGFSMAAIVDPLNNAQAAVLGSFYSIIATLSFLAVDGHHWMLAGFAKSYDTVALGQVPPIEAMLSNLMLTFSGLFGMAFQIAAPILVTLLMVDVVLGIISRVVPQMNVFFVGIPLKIGVGLLAVIISLPTFTGFMQSRIADVVAGASVLTDSDGTDDSRAATGTTDGAGADAAVTTASAAAPTDPAGEVMEARG